MSCLQSCSWLNECILAGGWCYSKVDCLGRSKTNLGSSKKWPQQFCAGGIMGADEHTNPAFGNFNKVVMAYCDGNSFASDRSDPLNLSQSRLSNGCLTPPNLVR